jgi:hypothetical protein
MQGIGTFADWVTEGSAFGVKAFFALFVFGMFCAACLGIVSLLTYALKGGEPDGEKKRRPY